jgi:hypothetical protein
MRVLNPIMLLAVLVAQSACAFNPATLPAPTAQQSCPIWVEYPVDAYSNAESPYLGCASDANLAATLENPEDLQHGRDLGPARGGRASISVGVYQNGQVKPLPASEPATPAITLSGATSGGPQ